MTFQSAFSEKVSFPCSSGSRFEPVYKFRIVNDVKTLVLSDETVDTDDLIQSYAPSCDLAAILRRCVDRSALYAQDEQFIDASRLPETVQDFYNVSLQLGDIFAQLDPEERAKYGNSVETYVISQCRAAASAAPVSATSDTKKVTEEVADNA